MNSASLFEDRNALPASNVFIPNRSKKANVMDAPNRSKGSTKGLPPLYPA
jgi:hypothetical protein